MELNGASAVEFFEWLFQRCERGDINLRFISDGKTTSEFIPLGTLQFEPEKLTPILERNKGKHSYFGVALREGKNGSKNGIIEIPALWVDLDGSPLDKVISGPYPPSAIVETSSGKFHVYWKLREAATKDEVPRVEDYLQRMAAYFGGDPAVKDASHILRIPQTSNFKTNPPFPVSVKEMNDREWDLFDFDDLPAVEQTLAQPAGPSTAPGDRIKKILDCSFLQHCDKDRAALPEPQWYAMVSILAREAGGRDLIHSLSRGYPKYSQRETDEKILHALSAGPLTCQKVKALWRCGRTCGVTSPVLLGRKTAEPAQRVASLVFPRETVGGWAAELADLYSSYLESPWPFFAFSALTCLGNLIADRVTLASEIAPQPRLFTVILGESGDDRKSEAIKKVSHFFDDALARGTFRVCNGVGSAEGLARILTEDTEDKKRLILVYDELKSFVSKATIEGQTLLPAVNSFFEGNRFQTATKTHAIDLREVYLSLLAASTSETYARMWTPIFLDIGFLNRLWLVKSHGERKFSIPREIPMGDIKALQRKLGALLAGLPQTYLKLLITEEARAIFDEWYFGLDPSPFSKRLDTYGLRLMIILAANETASSITPEIAQKVVTLLRWQVEVRRECDPVDAENNIAKMEEMIRRALARGPMEVRELQRKVNYHRYGLFAWRSGMDNLCRGREVYLDPKTRIYSLAR